VTLNYNAILIHYVLGCPNAAREVHTSKKVITIEGLHTKM